MFYNVVIAKKGFKMCFLIFFFFYNILTTNVNCFFFFKCSDRIYSHLEDIYWLVLVETVVKRLKKAINMRFLMLTVYK